MPRTLGIRWGNALFYGIDKEQNSLIDIICSIIPDILRSELYA